MRILYIIIMSLLWIWCSACRKKCKVHNYYLTEQQVSFGNFKKGSYWIMKDSITGAVDSFVVTGVGRSIADAQKISDGCYNKYEAMSFFIDEYNIASQTKVDSTDWQMSFYGSGLQVFWGSTKGNFHQVYFNFDRPVNNYLINGKLYDSVYVSEGSLFYFNFQDKIVKIVLEDTIVWELVRCHINI